MKFLLNLALVFLFGCASGHRQTSKKIRELVMANKHDSAIEFLKESSLASDEKSKLLYYLELGLLEHYKADYPKSIEALNNAKKIVDDLYTTKISGKVASSVVNDNADIYYGEKYEASLIHFYLALNHYMVGDLEKARAEILSWDTFLTEIKNERLGQALFKEDLLAKTFGALVHEAQGTNKDDQIALQLYKDANDVLFKNYNLFPTFNSKYEDFRKNYESLPGLAAAEVEKKFLKETEHSLVFEEFLTMKILMLTKKIRPNDFNAMVTKLKPSKDLLKTVKKSGGNITFLVQDGLIVEKIPKKYVFPINLGSHTTFAFTLGLGNNITYELPTVEPAPLLETARIQALDKDGKVIDESSLSIIAPLSELADQAINEHSKAIAAKTGARLATKHIAAVVAAYATYSAAQSRNDATGMLIATLGHAAAVATINESEKADVRYWSTLPSNIRMANLQLPEGPYKFRAVFGTEGLADYRTIDLGEQLVTKTGIKFVMQNKNLKYKSNYIANSDQPVLVKPEDNVTSTNPPAQRENPYKSLLVKTPEAGCMKDADCPQGTVCATVRGEYPGSCAGTGFLGGIGRNLSGDSANLKGCMTDADCSQGRVCATVRGEYPGSCAQK